jgi:hypothetical protein
MHSGIEMRHASEELLRTGLQSVSCCTCLQLGKNLSVISQDMSCNLYIAVARDGFLGAVDIDMVPWSRRKGQ